MIVSAADRRPDAPPHAGLVAQAAVLLACVFLATLAVPALGGLPGGASIGLLTMAAAMPVWFEAARARATPFDLAATRAIAVVLASAGFLIVWSLVSTFGVSEPIRASRYLATLFAGFATYFLVRGTVTRRRLILYVDVVAATLAATCAISLLAYEVGPLRDLIFRGTDRAAGFFKNPNQFGMTISTTIPSVLALLLAERSRRWLRAACLLLLLLGLLASGSKTNLLLASASMLVAMTAHALIAYSGLRRIGMLALTVLGSVAIVAGGIAALGVLNPRALRIMTAFLSQEGEVSSLMTRSFLWAYSVDQFISDPVLGQGAGQRIDIFYREADVSHSHNVLLDYMRSLGAPGLGAMACLLAAVVLLSLASVHAALRGARGNVADRLVCLGLTLSGLSYVAANMSSDSFGPSTSPFFWLFVYLGLASRRLLDRGAHGRQEPPEEEFRD